jgi:hypothetical protein
LAADGKVPRWKDAPCGGQYYPSTNIPPTFYTPIIVAGDKVSVFAVFSLKYAPPTPP